MAVKNILVSYNDTEAARSALALARLMAEKYEAHLTGILSYGPQELISSYAGYLPIGVAEQVFEADRAKRREVEAAFRSATEGLPADRVHFVDVFSSADDGLMDVARTYDLIVMGRGEPDSAIPHMEPHPDVVARHSGRPVLVVPKGYAVAVLNEHALVAWDGGRAAARALADAMQLLETKQKVTVLSVGTPGSSDVLAGITRHLERHHVPVEAVEAARDGRRTADVIIDTCKARGAGLLVMGAYEHAKFAEDLFGGVTSRVIDNSPIPVLLSH
jgi:nucleotide-binding universal stress UspA family protein